MHIVFKSREEAFKVLLGQFTLKNLLVASLLHQELHLIDIDVAILVDVDLLSEEFLKVLLRLELILEMSIHLNHLLLYKIELVSWNFLTIQDSKVIIEHVLLRHVAKV